MHVCGGGLRAHAVHPAFAPCAGLLTYTYTPCPPTLSARRDIISSASSCDASSKSFSTSSKQIQQQRLHQHHFQLSSRETHPGARQVRGVVVDLRARQGPTCQFLALLELEQGEKLLELEVLEDFALNFWGWRRY